MTAIPIIAVTNWNNFTPFPVVASNTKVLICSSNYIFWQYEKRCFNKLNPFMAIVIYSLSCLHIYEPRLTNNPFAIVLKSPFAHSWHMHGCSNNGAVSCCTQLMILAIPFWHFYLPLNFKVE